MSRTPLSDKVSKEVFRYAYHDLNWSTVNLAEYFGYDSSHIGDVMKELGIRMKTNSEAGRTDYGISKADLYKMRQRDCKSVREIAEHFGVSSKVIKNRLSWYDIERSWECVSKRRLQKLYFGDPEYTLKEIADKFNCHHKTMAKVFDKYGIERRHAFRKTKLSKSRIKYLYKNRKLTLEETAQMLGVSMNVLISNMDRYGIERRCQSDYDIEITTGGIYSGGCVVNPEACDIIDEFGDKNGFNFIHGKNGGEFSVPNLRYQVDGYDEDQNVVIEYYEKWHRKQKDYDYNRKLEIIEELGCDFFELYWDGRKKVTLGPSNEPETMNEEDALQF